MKLSFPPRIEYLGSLIEKNLSTEVTLLFWFSWSMVIAKAGLVHPHLNLGLETHLNSRLWI